MTLQQAPNGSDSLLFSDFTTFDGDLTPVTLPREFDLTTVYISTLQFLYGPYHRLKERTSCLLPFNVLTTCSIKNCFPRH